MTDTLPTPSALDIRDELEAMMRRDLLGPAGGPEEQVTERTVRGRYVLGLLAPNDHTPFVQDVDPADEVGDIAADGDNVGEDGKPDPSPPDVSGTVSLLPSSMGMTFSVEGGTDTLVVSAAWGRYHRVIDEEDEPPAYYWQREPVAGEVEVALREGDTGRLVIDPDQPEVYVRGQVRKRGVHWGVTLFLINGQEEPKLRKDEAWVFQPELAVRAPDGAPVFLKRGLPESLNVADPEDRAMEMLYRRELEFAVGHGVGIHAELNDWERAVSIRTDILPAAEVERMDPPTVADIPLLGEVEFDMKALFEIEMGGFEAALSPLVDAYETWIDEREAQLDDPPPDLAPYAEDGTAKVAMESCREALGRIRAGIELLDRDEQAAEAFRFANHAMWQQRVHTVYAGLRRQEKGVALADIDVPRNRTWRPFQLAFVLLNLPALADPTHLERSEVPEAYADLLWFPTGGGKTEAYLGVAAFTMGIRRLQGELSGYAGGAGVAVLMRYTLRLLTLQQFQRAAALIAACEIIRRADPARWGLEPFRIGLWVGQRSTPNWTSQSAEAVKRMHGQGWHSGFGPQGTPVQLTNCLWCGSPIDPGKHIRVETYKQGRARTFQYCGDWQCPFSEKNAPDEGLPIVVVDEEIYRRLPTLLIATVDKFAQMPWKGEVQTLFGRVTGYCPRHGYTSPDINDASSHRQRGKLPAVRQQEDVGPLRPPDLIIQDELHLISGPLGTLVGLYETAVDGLSTWELDGKLVRPKVIASTATVRRAQNQVHNLFLRQVKIFPPPALNADDNFFARRRPSIGVAPARRYLGICASGTRMKTVLIRIYVALMAAAQMLYEKYGRAADPYMTLVGYFSSMRELGGMRRVVDDVVSTRLTRMDERGLTKRFIDPYSVEELTSRKDATEIPQILDKLETPFDPNNSKEWPLDVVLATNMISVGVDVNRLGLMVVAGQPKATAEYIQATSRVGRRYPGLVCTVYNWARPRDLSHYERFEHYHATFYQHVEALSVTPFSPRALDRGLTGVLVGYLRLLDTRFNPNKAAGDLDRPDDLLDAAVEAISWRAGQVTASSATAGEVQAAIKKRIDEWLHLVGRGTGQLGYKGEKDSLTLGLLKHPEEEDWDLFTCLNSLRDVEPNVALILNDEGMDSPDQTAPGVESEVTS